MPIVSSSMDRLLCSPLIPLRREAAGHTTQFRPRDAETRPLGRRLSCRPNPLDRRRIPELNSESMMKPRTRGAFRSPRTDGSSCQLAERAYNLLPETLSRHAAQLSQRAVLTHPRNDLKADKIACPGWVCSSLTAQKVARIITAVGGIQDSIY